MPNMSKKAILGWAARMGVPCDLCSIEGERINRFEFYDRRYPNGGVGRTIGYAMGAREAELFLRGYQEGRDAARGGR